LTAASIRQVETKCFCTPDLARISFIKHHLVNAGCKRLRPAKAVKRCQQELCQ